MKAGLPALALTLALGLAACVPAAKAPPAPVAPAPRPAHAPAARAPQPAVSQPAAPGTRWMDMPRSPGDWRYAARGGRTEASFWSPAGTPLARLACLTDSRTVVLSLPESGAARAGVTIRTETAARAFEARRGDRDMSVALAATDPLLDAMALSKGTFAVEAEGLPALYLPSWAEISRVIEDCR